MKAKTGQNEKTKEKKKSQRGIAVKTRLQMSPEELYSHKFPWVMRLIWLLKSCVWLSLQWHSQLQSNTSICLAHESLHTDTRTPTHLLHSLHGWWRILVAAEVNDDPGNIAEEGDGDWWVDERKQGLDHTQGDNIIPALWTITCSGKVQRLSSLWTVAFKHCEYTHFCQRMILTYNVS